MTGPVILDMRPVDPPENVGRGQEIFARFDVVICGIALSGCALSRRKGKGLRVWSPSRFVRFSADVRNVMKAAALAALEAMDRP